ncbi:MAG: hypothetical protein KDC94_12365 [Aequorivita sp.]|jgi:hypothetical protein|nr:hypothetical protein [Aequorivita sp.]
MKTKANSLSLPNLISNKFQLLKKTSIKTLMFIFFPALMVLVAIAMVSQIYQVPLNDLTSDTAAIAGINPLYGVLSNLGVILWCAATFSCALAAMILRYKGPEKLYLFLLYSSLLSAYLMLDDLFQFHEDLSSDIGLNQKVVYLFLVTAVITYLIYFRKILLQTNIIPFLIALGFLFLSVFTDTIVYKIFGDQLGDWLYLIEDGAKWLGIVFWCYYFFDTSFQLIMKNTGIPNNTN